MSTQKLEDEHQRAREKAIAQFKNTRKMGGEEFSKSYEDRLAKELDDSFSNFLKFNESKNVFKAFRTPAVLFTCVVITYLLASIFGAVGLYLFANLVNLMMGIALLMLCLWGYIRYSGDLREVGTHIDMLAVFIWENGLKPMYAKIVMAGLIPPEAVSQTLSRAALTNVRQLTVDNSKKAS